MVSDIWAVFWRELRQNRAQYDDRRRLVLGLAVTTLFIVSLEIMFGIHRELREAQPILLIWIWCWLPLGSAVTMATDTIAGERERHTLETLLATRLPARAILVGKVLAIAAQAWISAAGLALGILLALNAVTIWSGTLVGYPLSVVLAGSVISFLLTLLGTLTALLLSMNAPTVRQANLRVIVITSMLPVLLVVPIALIIVVVLVALAVAAQLTGLTFDSASRPSGVVLSTIAWSSALLGLLIAIAGVFAITALRFNRARLMRTFAPDQSAAHAEAAKERAVAFELEAHSAGHALSYSGDDPGITALQRETPLAMVLRDAAAVAWKEVTEARALVREWRGWLLLAAIVVLGMAFQMSVFVSWFWTQGEHFSLMYWLGMAAVLPVLIAQRSADAVAGERERHTGEILFTTRLSEPGILLGKLSAVALLPWLLALAIPAIGLLTTNLFYAASGPFWYPPEVAVAGSALSLGVALLFASAGMLVSLGAPTVQHAARRISWFLMPILIAPGLIFRGSFFGAATEQDQDALREGFAGLIGSGDALRIILVVAPLLFFVNGALIALLWRRFVRGQVAFD